MKIIILLMIASANLVFGDENADDALSDALFAVSVRGGIIEVVSDRTKNQVIPADGRPSINIETLKKAWKSCYGALILNETKTLGSFFFKGAPRNLQALDGLEGQVRFLTVSTIGNSVRIVLKLEVLGASNNVNVLYDAHIWRVNESGEWEVETAIYQ